jgi:ankyrin repeat protein
MRRSCSILTVTTWRPFSAKPEETTTDMSKTRLVEAVHHLDVKAARKLVDQNSSLLTVTDRSGRNLLHLACSVSCKELGVAEAIAARLVNWLLDCGLDVESTLVADGYPCNSVWFAVARGKNATLVKLLVKRGATPRGLFAAGWYEDLRMLALLLRLGASIDEKAEDETPFLHCWKSRRFRSAKVLVERGADVNFRDSTGSTALHYGVRKGFEPPLLRHLVRSGASPDIEDQRGVSPRQLASRKRDPRFLAALA